MSNNKQISVEWLYDNLNKCFEKFDNGEYSYTDFVNASKEVKQQAKAMQQEQAQLYATFVLKCVNNNLPPITFNDWINLENNEQQ